MDTVAQSFLSEIERFLEGTGLEPTSLGKQALGDPNFVFDLRKGRSPSTRTVDKVRAWMAQQSSAARPARQASTPTAAAGGLTHLERLEAESIHIIREVAAECEKPVMLYSIGKDSAVMLHLAIKAFYPSKPPFPLLHVDTGWKFRDMYAMRAATAKKYDWELIVHKNLEGVAKNVNPFDHGSALHTQIMKTDALKQALDKYGEVPPLHRALMAGEDLMQEVGVLLAHVGGGLGRTFHLEGAADEEGLLDLAAVHGGRTRG